MTNLNINGSYSQSGGYSTATSLIAVSGLALSGGSLAIGGDVMSREIRPPRLEAAASSPSAARVR